MLLRKQEPLSSKPIKTYETTLLWCSDGWVYDTTAKTRRRYKTDGNLFSMEEEPTSRTVYSDVEYVEEAKIIVISETPRIWIEQGEMFTQI